MLLAATVLASSAVAAERRANQKEHTTTCRGVLTATPGSEDTYSLGHCRIYAFDNLGEALRRACKVGDRCTARARVYEDMVTHLYSVTRSS